MMYPALSRDDYPGLDPSEAGRYPAFGYGAVEGVRAPAIEAGATSTLIADVTSSETSIEVADADGFSAPPFTVQVAGELMRVTAVDGNVLTVTRGWNETLASPHAAGMTVFEARTRYVYLISPEPVHAIGRVYVDGIPQEEGYTAYTGQPGDEHPDYPGCGVVVFDTEEYASRQRGALGTGTRTRDALVSAASHADAVDEASVGVALGGTRRQIVWAAFTGRGQVSGRSYKASVTNNGVADTLVRAVVREGAGGAVLGTKRLFVPAGAAAALSFEQSGGDWDTVLALLPAGPRADLTVRGIAKTVTAVDPPEEEALETYDPEVAASSFSGADLLETATLGARGKRIAWASYAAVSYGMVAAQTHRAEVVVGAASDARVRLMAVAGDLLIAVKDVRLAAGDSATLTLRHEGGDWDSVTKLMVVSGAVRADALAKSVEYLPSGAGLAGEPLTTASARVVIGDQVTVDAEWAVDLSGEYGGVGALIERPDYVIRHFLVERLGFAPGEIDDDAFNEAGAAYASAIAGGYALGFVVREKTAPSEYLRDLAFQSRSTLAYRAGQWRLAYVPDAAPAPVRTISRAELAGAGAMFVYRRTPVVDIANSIGVKYKAVYDQGVPGGGEWLGSVAGEDAASIAAYGEYAKEFEFGAVRDGAMAAHVLEHILVERKTPLLRVTFTVFWEHFDLEVGDTIEIDDELYGGRRFYIEEIERPDRFTARITAREWRG
jgi:hypothetical protein